MTVGVLLAAAGIGLVAGACQAFTAFGFALLMVPLLSLAWEVKPAVVTSTLLGTALIIPLLYEVRSRVEVSRVGPMLAGSLLGVAPGIVVLKRIEAEALEVLVASVVIVAALALSLSPRLPLRGPNPLLSFLVGTLSGALRAATSMGGPPVVLYTIAYEEEVERFRATLLALFLPTSLATVAALAATGLIDGDVLLASAVALPAVAAGSVAGAWLRTRVSVPLFRFSVLALLIGGSVAVLLSAVGPLG